MHDIFFAYSTRLALFLLMALTLSGCATTDSQHQPSKLRDKELYDFGRSALAANDFNTAVDSFKILSARPPATGYSTHALLDLAYAHYKLGDHELALASVDRYVAGAKQRVLLDYAYYLKGLIYVDQATLLAQQHESNLEVATTLARQGYLMFNDLVQNFSSSKYATSASRHMASLRENLAGFEVRMARRFLGQANYMMAAERARYVLENYPDTPAVADAVRLLRDISDTTGNSQLLPTLPETRPLPNPPATGN